MSLHSAHIQMMRIKSIVRAQAWRLLHPGLDVGRRVRIGRGCRLFLDQDARLVLEDGCVIDDGVTLAIYGSGCIELGQGTFIGHHCTLAAHESIHVGAGTYLAELVSIRDHDHAIGVPLASGRSEVRPVVIGGGVWIGAKATVIRGARVGAGAVVGANAVVRGDLPARSVCVGVPARVVRTYAPDEDQPSTDEPSH